MSNPWVYLSLAGVALSALSLFMSSRRCRAEVIARLPDAELIERGVWDECDGEPMNDCAEEYERRHGISSSAPSTAEGAMPINDCSACGKMFTFTTSILYCYAPAKADCLNEGAHQWQMTKTYPKRFTRWQCKGCDAEKSLTETEMQDLLAKEPE